MAKPAFNVVRIGSPKGPAMIKITVGREHLNLTDEEAFRFAEIIQEVVGQTTLDNLDFIDAGVDGTC